MEASYRGHINVVLTALEAGADINMQNEVSLTYHCQNYSKPLLLTNLSKFIFTEISSFPYTNIELKYQRSNNLTSL